MVEAAIYFPAVIIVVAIIICITIVKLDACLVQTRAETVTQERAMEALGEKYKVNQKNKKMAGKHLIQTAGNSFKTTEGSSPGVNRVYGESAYRAVLPAFFGVMNRRTVDVKKKTVTGFSADMPELIRASDMMRHYPDYYLRYTDMPYYIYRETIAALLSGSR